mmetsp:Transcript_12992/g.22690  ORF Transcript_12992/g.22690 Transcript_12992/m.22690 type:complete len:348 (+) Transcript_12992:133-1176(+)
MTSVAPPEEKKAVEFLETKDGTSPPVATLPDEANASGSLLRVGEETASSSKAANGRKSAGSKGKSRRNIGDQPPNGRISVRSINFGIPSNMGAQEHVVDTHGIESWRAAALRFLHQKWFQMMIVSLLILDVLILFTELLLMAEFPSCSIIERDCIACCYEPGNGDGHERWLAGDSHHEETCQVGYEESGEPACDGHKWSNVHLAEEVLFACTITILTIFLAEICVEMWALTPCIFFKQIFYALDFVIVTVSIVLELTFHFAHKDLLEELAGLLVFGRLWRFVRIGHGIIEVTSEFTHQQYEELMEYANECAEELEANHLMVPETTKRVKKMISDLNDTSHGGHSRQS